jgi:thiol-disulfide isomerase/thioredoxin
LFFRRVIKNSSEKHFKKIKKHMNKLNIYILLVSSVFFGCSNENKNDLTINKKSLTGDVVLILKNIPTNWKYSPTNDKRYVHAGKHELEYSLNGIIPTYYLPEKSSKKNDTIIIKNIDDPIEIIHKYRGLDKFSFIIKPNDTLIFNYIDKMPLLKSNSKTTKHEYDYERLLRANIIKGNFPSYYKYTSRILFLMESIKSKSTESFKKRYDDYKKESLKNALLEFSQSKNLLDSLKKNSFLSNESYNFYNLRLKFRKKTLDIGETDNLILKNYFQNDSLIKFSFYREYISALVEEAIVKSVTIKKSSNYSVPNPEAVYDSIQINSYLSRGSKKYLSFVWLENIMSTSSNKNVEKYFNEFKSNYKNESKLIEYFIEKYKLDYTYSKDLYLLDEHGHKTTLQRVLDSNRGKLVYIDFWASWCAPCRQAMPSSHKLKEKFKGKEVAFIYLALNDNKEKWQKASIEENLSGNNDNYFIVNSKTSSFIDDLDIITIPRYLIYDKTQKLIYKNAPSPNDDGLTEILNSLLTE